MAQTIPTDLIAPLYSPQTFGRRGAVDDMMREVRARFPLAVAEVPGYDPHWIVSRHADVAEVSKRNADFANAVRSATLIPLAGEELVRHFTDGDPNLFHSLVQMDGEEHRAHRAVTVKAFAPKEIGRLTAKVERAAGRLVERLENAGGTVEWAQDIAAAFPLGVVLDLVGIPEQDHAEMLRLTRWLFSGSDPDLARPGADLGDPVYMTQSWKLIFDEFSDYYLGVIADRRNNPRDDIATLIANASIDGRPMSDWNAVSYFAILATAGHDSSAHTIATAMWELAENPDLLVQLRAEPALIPAFVDESIRWATPVKQFVRTATVDTELAGERIAAGDRLYLSYPSANRDEAVFPEPFRFRLDRGANRHLSFGFGGHVCLGQHLARLEMRLLWQALLPRLEHVEMAAEGRLIQSEFVSGPKAVPIRYTLN